MPATHGSARPSALAGRACRRRRKRARAPHGGARPARRACRRPRRTDGPAGSCPRPARAAAARCRAARALLFCNISGHADGDRRGPMSTRRYLKTRLAETFPTLPADSICSPSACAEKLSKNRSERAAAARCCAARALPGRVIFLFGALPNGRTGPRHRSEPQPLGTSLSACSGREGG